MSNNIPLLLLFLPIFIVSLSIHEWAHAYSAWKLGDPTAKERGRMTVNPVAHIDPIGTLLLPALSLLSGGIIIGWAKPVPVDTRRLKSPSRDMALVAGAGPLSNLLQAAAGAALFGLMEGDPDSLLRTILFFYILFNLSLAFFNLLPIPPLDGSRLLYPFLPESLKPGYRDLERYGFLILIGLIFVGMALNLNLILGWVFFFIKLVAPFYDALMGAHHLSNFMANR